MKKIGKKRPFFRGAVRLSGSLLILAAGMVGSITLSKNLLKANDKTENIVLNNAKNEFENNNKRDVSYALTDLYLYKSKGIKVTMLPESPSHSYNSSIKEISRLEGGKLVAIKPTNKDYNKVLELREYLSKNLSNKNIFNKKENSEAVKFVDFLKKQRNRKNKVRYM
jgi:hypothetical protein